MDLKKKVASALRRSLGAANIRLEDDDGISGYVVSERFRGMSSMARQRLIRIALRDATANITKAELHQVLAIAGMTPTEYEALGYSA